MAKAKTALKGKKNGSVKTAKNGKAVAAPEPLFTDLQRRNALHIQRCFIDRRNYLRKNRMNLEDAIFEDGLEEYETEDRDTPGKNLSGFIQFALPYTKVFQGQVMQDIWALYETDGKEEGYFVDFGATNGTTLSNSVVLERHFGWDGIVAEPNPTYHERIHESRKCNVSTKCVHSSSGDTLDFICAERPMFSRLGVASEGAEFEDADIEQSIPVPTITLNDLLDEHDAPEVIDFISIDTEGSELDILEAFDFSKRRVNMFTIEHNFQPRRDEIYRIMSENGFVRRFPEMSRFDDWYIQSDLV